VRQYWVRVGDDEFAVAVEEAEGGLRVTIGNATHWVELTEAVPSVYTLLVDGACHDLAVWSQSSPLALSLDGSVYTAEVARTKRPGVAGSHGAGALSQEVRAPMPGLLLALPASEGARVEIGQAVAIMEAMKMQMEIRAPHAGVIKRLHVSPGQELSAGQLLVTME
jgi:geranyl-CoA carboxylase alpha subunit